MNREFSGSESEELETVMCVGAVALKARQVLFVRQASGHPLEGQWSIPWGILDAGESPDEAVLREVLEEGGITAEVVGLLGLQNLPRPGWFALLFLCQHLEGVPVADGRETDAARYLSLRDMDALGEPVEPWCDWLVRRVLAREVTALAPVPDNPYWPCTAYL